MTELFNITHDADDLSEYNSTVTDGGDLSTNTPGLAGSTAKMVCLIDDTTAIYGRKDQTAPVSGLLRLRFYIDPNGISMDVGEQMVVLLVQSEDSPFLAVVVWLKYDGSNYEIAAAMGEDGGGDTETATYDISDAEHYVEIYLTQHASTASLTLWIDGVEKEAITGKDNFDVFESIYAIDLGMVFTADDISATYYLDELVANDDGNEIGPVAAAGQPTNLRATTIPGMRQWQPRIGP